MVSGESNCSCRRIGKLWCQGSLTAVLGKLESYCVRGGQLQLLRVNFQVRSQYIYYKLSVHYCQYDFVALIQVNIAFSCFKRRYFQ